MNELKKIEKIILLVPLLGFGMGLYLIFADKFGMQSNRNPYWYWGTAFWQAITITTIFLMTCR